MDDADRLLFEAQQDDAEFGEPSWIGDFSRGA
jgi:hypothetical protein